MKGIVLKDLYECFCIKSHTIEWIVSITFFILFTIFFKIQYMTVLNMLCIPLLGSCALEYSVEQDEKAHFNKIQLSYPLTKQEIVLSKYVTGLILLSMTIFASLILHFLHIYVFHTLSLNDGMAMWKLSIVIAIIFFSITYFVFFVLGYKKGLIVYIFFVFIVAIFLSTMISFVSFSWFCSFIHSLSFVRLLLISLVFLMMSYLLSLKIYIYKNN